MSALPQGYDTPVGERGMKLSLDKLVIGRTGLIIARRLSTIRRATRIHVMEAGRIVETCSHVSPVAPGGLYAAQWRLQVGDPTGG